MNKTPGRSAADILYDRAVSWRRSAMLFAALDLDLFSAIPPEGATSAQIAQQGNFDERSLRILMNCLVNEGYLRLADEVFRIPEAFADLLRKGNGYWGDHLLWQREHLPIWLKLPDIVRNDPSSKERYYDALLASSKIDMYLDNVLKCNTDVLGEYARTIQQYAPAATSALDVGGGHGHHAASLLRWTSLEQVTILDVEKAIDSCRRRHRDADYFAGMRFQVGDARALPFRDAFDVVTMNDLLHYFSAEEKLQVTRGAFQAVRPGGILAVSDFHLSEDGTSPPNSAMFSLKIRVNTSGQGYLPTDREYHGMMREACQEEVQSFPLGQEKTMFIARKALSC